MQTLVILLSEGVVYLVEVLEPIFYGLEIVFIAFFKLFLDSHHIFLELNQLFGSLGLHTNGLKAALNLFE